MPAGGALSRTARYRGRCVGKRASDPSKERFFAGKRKCLWRASLIKSRLRKGKKISEKGAKTLAKSCKV